MDSTPSDRARRVPPSVPQALEHGKLRRGCELRNKSGRVPSSRNIDTQDEERRRRAAFSPLCIYFYLSGTKERKEEVRPIGTEVKPCSKALEHFWNRVEHWNSGEGLPWATDPRGEGLSRSRSAAGLRPHESRPKAGRPGAGRRRIEQRPQLLRPARNGRAPVPNLPRPSGRARRPRLDSA